MTETDIQQHFGGLIINPQSVKKVIPVSLPDGTEANLFIFDPPFNPTVSKRDESNFRTMVQVGNDKFLIKEEITVNDAENLIKRLWTKQKEATL